ncbi:MAG: sensor histidine kinase [Firmicutes bacterium]|nr:sensor histidine kinase [Dethiobacter sp.]MBS3889023.1 sensor histidine kinase [Bacillota bacterium]MBS4053739.1 sensor histidine kinase [Thermaerobacter sp.]
MVTAAEAPSFQSKLLPLLYLASLTVFVSNFSYFPFGTAFRFSLAVSAFALFLLLRSDVNPAVGGIVTGVAIVLFRTVLSTYMAGLPMVPAFLRHYPAGVYYLCFGSGLLLARHLVSSTPLYIISLLGALDFSSNIAELILRGDFALRLEPTMFYLLLAVAAIRATLTGLAYTAYLQKEDILRREQRQREFERLLLLTSDVNGELLYFEHALEDVERVMHKSYQLYHKLRDDNRDEAAIALAVTREIHDAKKDFARLGARLNAVLLRERADKSLALHTLVEVAVKANQALALELGKKVQIHSEITGAADISNYHHVLSIINNLMSNAVDAIVHQGEVWLKLEVNASSLAVTVADNGVGINLSDLPIIFRPGFTTKFNPHNGQASTGLGLAQVQNIAESLGGKITVRSEVGSGTLFTVTLPIGGSFV